MVYLQLLCKFEATSISAEAKSKWNAADEEAFEVKLTLLQAQKPPQIGDKVIQGNDKLFTSDLSSGEGFTDSECGSFSDSSVFIYASFSDEKMRMR